MRGLGSSINALGPTYLFSLLLFSFAYFLSQSTSKVGVLDVLPDFIFYLNSFSQEVLKKPNICR